jgi:hypothetical protein
MKPAAKSFPIRGIFLSGVLPAAESDPPKALLQSLKNLYAALFSCLSGRLREEGTEEEERKQAWIVDRHGGALAKFAIYYEAVQRGEIGPENLAQLLRTFVDAINAHAQACDPMKNPPNGLLDTHRKLDLRFVFHGRPPWNFLRFANWRIEAVEELQISPRLQVLIENVNYWILRLRNGGGNRTTSTEDRQIGDHQGSVGKADRATAVKSFLGKVKSAIGRAVTKKDFWTVAGYKERSEFERYQRNDPKTTRSAIVNFDAVLKLTPVDFIRQLDARNRK